MHFSQTKFCESGKGFYESGESGNPEGVAPMPMATITFSIAYPIYRSLYTHLSFDVIGSDWTGMRTKEKIELVGGHFLKFC